jgi:hypothetical protein
MLTLKSKIHDQPKIIPQFAGGGYAQPAVGGLRLMNVSSSVIWW